LQKRALSGFAWPQLRHVVTAQAYAAVPSEGYPSTAYSLSFHVPFDETEANDARLLAAAEACENSSPPASQPPRGPTSRQVSTAPLPFTSTSPSGSAAKSSRTSSHVDRVIWMSSGVPWDSILLAMFTVSPQRS
jgi:hypothetical protein